MNEDAVPHMVAARFLIAPLLGFLLSVTATGTPAATAAISGSWSGQCGFTGARPNTLGSD